jgi:hypothetical protein
MHDTDNGPWPVSVHDPVCGDNVHTECRRYAREFCLYPFQLPAVLLEPSTYTALERRGGPRTDRYVQRKGRRGTPLVPGEINTLAPTRTYVHDPPFLSLSLSLCCCARQRSYVSLSLSVPVVVDCPHARMLT